MDGRTGGEDRSGCPFRPSTALEGLAGYAQSLDLGNSLHLASVARAAYVRVHTCDSGMLSQ